MQKREYKEQTVTLMSKKMPDGKWEASAVWETELPNVGIFDASEHISDSENLAVDSAFTAAKRLIDYSLAKRAAR